MRRVPNIDNARVREMQLELYAEHLTNGRSKESWSIAVVPVLHGVTVLLKRWAFVESEGQLHLRSHPITTNMYMLVLSHSADSG